MQTYHRKKKTSPKQTEQRRSILHRLPFGRKHNSTNKRKFFAIILCYKTICLYKKTHTIHQKLKILNNRVKSKIYLRAMGLIKKLNNVTIKLIVGNSKEQTLNIAEISIISIEKGLRQS